MACKKRVGRKTLAGCTLRQNPPKSTSDGMVIAMKKVATQPTTRKAVKYS